MRSLLYGIFLIILVGVGGFMYRNAVEYPKRPSACTMDAKVCPDGTALGRSGPACEFPACPPPNVSLADIGIAFAVPNEFSAITHPDESAVAAYDQSDPVSLETSSIIIRRFLIGASSTALSTIQETAISGASGLPVPITAFSSSVLGSRRFTVVQIERFEAVITTAYYLARETDVLRFDAIDRGVLNWTDPGLDTLTLPAHAALRTLLVSLQSG